VKIHNIRIAEESLQAPYDAQNLKAIFGLEGSFKKAYGNSAASTNACLLVCAGPIPQCLLIGSKYETCLRESIYSESKEGYIRDNFQEVFGLI
jgi:hypothetical protein